MLRLLILLLLVGTLLAQQAAPILSTQSSGETLTLAEAKREAVRNSPNLDALRARVVAAAAVWRQARATLAPSLVLSYSASRLHEQVGEGGLIAEPDSHTSLGMELRYLLFDGYLREHQVAAAEHDQLAVELSLQDALRGLRFAVARSYLGIQLAEAQERVAQAELETNQLFLADLNKRVELGAGSRADTVNFQLRMNNAKLRVRNAQRDAKVSRHALLALMGRAHDSPVTVVREPLDGLPFAVEEARRVAMKNRPDLEQRKEELRAAKARVLSARSAFSPTVAVSGQAGFVSDRLVDVREEQFHTSATASVNWQLADGGQRRAGVDLAQANVESADFLLLETWQAIVREVSQALEDYDAALDNFSLYKQNVALSRQQVEDTQTKYEQGAETLTRVNEVLTSLALAEGNMAAGEVAVSLARENLLHIVNPPAMRVK